MKIGFILTRHRPSRASPIMPEVVRLLRGRGVQVELIYPDEQLTDLGTVDAKQDLYVLKSGSELALSLAAALHATGAALLNAYPVAAACRDKIASTRILQKAGLPTPTTYVTGTKSELAPLLRSGPLVIKPHRGSQGRGVRVVRDPRELDSLTIELDTVFAQRYHEHDGRDRKIYCIGEEVFGVKRRWPANTYRDKVGEPFTVSQELRELALSCGRALGMELYGLDIIMCKSRAYIVDVSSFPGFKGVPNAASRLADYVYETGQRVTRGEPAVPRSHQASA